MFARYLSIHLKSNMLSDYNLQLLRTTFFLTSQAEGFQGRNHILKFQQPRRDCDKSVGEQSECRSLQHQ
jgi:hypothetical protein